MPRIFIDPGHGGRDSGAIGHYGNKEKDINLQVGLKLREILKEVAQVNLSRDADIALGADVNADLRTRSNTANMLDADAFISIHCNAAGNPKAGGVETYCYKHGTGGETLARAIHMRLAPATGLKDRGVKTKDLAVLRETKMPAVLVELAFISNPTEEKLLVDPAWQDKVAQAIAQGVKEFLGINDNPDPVPEWARPAVNWAVEHGIVNNREGSYDFYRTAAMMYKYHKKFGVK